MITPRDYGHRILGTPWDLGTPKATKVKKKRLQLWREDLKERFTVRPFPNKSAAMEYAEAQGFAAEDFRII